MSVDAAAGQVPGATPVPGVWAGSDRPTRGSNRWPLAPLGRALRTLMHSRGGDRELAVAAERRRIARELHDGVAQDLAFIVSQSLQLTRSFPDEPALQRIAAAAERALVDSRMAIYALARPRPHALGAAVREHAQEIAERAGLLLRLEIDDEIETTPEIEHAVRRIITEAASNAVRHADAAMLLISISSATDGLHVRIADDGRGFDPARIANSKSYGFGLVSMSERARSLGGELTLSSGLGVGTVVELRVP